MMLIQKDKKSFQLFNKEFRPGLLCDGTHCIAVKCKLFGLCYNRIEDNSLYVLGDKQLVTRNCFVKSISDNYPVRVCIYTEMGYEDRGWGLPQKICNDGKYMLDIGPEIQEQFQNFEYPKYPGEITLKSTWTMYVDWIYESKLEAKYAKFFNLCGIPYIPQPPSLPSTTGDWWRTDFLLWPENEQRKCFVEIKPGKPYEEEELKCETAAHHVDPFPIILFYGEMSPPFVFDQGKDRDRPNGVCGIRWKKIGSSVYRDHVVFKYRDDITIDSRTSTLDMSWAHPHLITIYSESNNTSDMEVVKLDYPGKSIS